VSSSTSIIQRRSNDASAQNCKLFQWGSLLAALLTAGCAGTTPVEGVPPKEARVQVEAPIDELVRYDEPISLLTAVRGDGALLISYEANGETHSAKATWEQEQNISVHSDWFPVYYLEPIEPGALADATKTAEPVAMYPVELWQEFRREVFHELTPEEPFNGVLLNYRDIEYVWYRNDNAELIGVDLKEKPPGLPVAKSYRIESMTETLFPIMERFLSERGIEARRLVIATGETGAYARPFLVLNLDDSALAFLSLEKFTFGSKPSNPVVGGAKLGGSIVRSYIFEPFNRPVSFVSRLFFFLTDTLVDATRGIYVRNFAYPDIEETDIPPLNTGPGMDLAAWEDKLDRKLGKRRYSGSVEVLVDGDGYFPRLIESVIDAKDNVKMRTYIFDGDDYAVSLADLLKRRSAEIGVDVMVDGLGTMMAQNAGAGTMPEDYEAPIAITNYLKSDSEVRVRDLTNPWTAGDHTKTTIIDSDHAYIGGMNIGREYRWEWHDMMMRVEGSIVDYIEEEFDRTWAQGAILGDFVMTGHVLGNHLPPGEDIEHPIRPILTLPRRSAIYHSQIEAARNARSYIYVQNAYLSSTVIIHELAKARLRGVDVRVIIPMEGNHGVLNASNVIAANTLLKYGVRVFIYPGMSHIKAAIYDGWACAGSANFDKLSFRVNKEMNLGSSDPDFVRQLTEKVFEPDFAAAVELKEPLPSGWKNTFANIVSSQL